MNTKTLGKTLVRHAIAVIAVVVATGARLALDAGLGRRQPFFTYYFAVVFVAWYAGVGPSIVAVVLACLAAAYCFVPPYHSFQIGDPGDQIAAGLFVAVCAAFIAFGWANRSARRRLEREVEERTRAETAEREHRERLHATILGVADAVIVTDAGGRVITINPVAEALTGWSWAKAVGAALDDVFRAVGEETGAAVESLAQRVLEQGTVVGPARPTRLLARDGAARPVDVRAAPVRDPSGTVVGAVLIFRDVTEARRAEAQNQESADQIRLLLDSTGEAIYGIDLDGRCTFSNPACARMLGVESPADLLGKPMHALIHHARSDGTGYPDHECQIDRAFRGGEGSHVDDEVLWRADGTSFPAEYRSYPIRRGGQLVGSVVTFVDVADRKRAEATIAEQVRLAEFGRDIGGALTRGASLREMLTRCVEVTVRHLDAAFARIWTVNEAGDTLELQASAGLYVHIDGPHGRVPVGQFKIGRIALEKRPHLTNAVIGDPLVPAQDWAAREGLVAFAGYPLIVDDRLVGVVALFARRALSTAAIAMLGSVADEIALGVERKRTEERLHRQQEWLRVTLSSIGDAVIATDVAGRVTFLNPVAESLTGWTRADAVGAALETVFQIVNESTRAAVESPAIRALREGTVVGLANHTILIARDGVERSIDDSAAPIRDETGAVMGAVLIFRDVARRRTAERALEASEALKTAILDSALDAIVTSDRRGRIIEWNPAAEAIFGHAAAAAVGRELSTLIIPPAAREPHLRGMRRLLETGASRILGRRIEVAALHADGSEFPVEMALTRIEADGATFFTAHVRDITARKALDRRRNARLAVTQRLAESSTLDEAAPLILQAVCDGLEWDAGVFWTAVEGADALHCLAAWHAPAIDADQFEALCRSQSFTPGVGLPGRVWALGRPAWVTDVNAADAGTVDGVVVRSSPHAAALGLHGAFAAPITLGDRFLGVIEFFSVRVKEPDLDLLEMMATVGGQIGLFADRRRVEAERLRLTAVIEHSPDFISLADETERILFVNRAGRRLVGLDAGSDVGRTNVLDYFPDAERARLAHEVMPVLRATGHWDGEVVFRNFQTDATIPVLWNVFTLPSPVDGKPYFACVSRDITERKRAEQRLGLLAEAGAVLAGSLDPRVTLQSIARLAVAGFADVCFFDLSAEDGRVERVAWARADPQAQATLDALRRDRPPTIASAATTVLPSIEDGWLPGAGSGLEADWDDLRALDVRSLIIAPVPSRDRTVGSVTFGLVGPRRQFNASDVQLAEDLGRRAGISIHNAMLYRQAEEANQAKDQFLAVLSHELRTPLNPILLAATSMLERPIDPDELRPTLEMIRQNVNLQARLIDDLLDVMRIVRGKMPLQWEIVDGHRLIDQAVRICRAEVSGKALRLETELNSARHHVDADPARLQQVFWNLIKNAVKFTPAGGTVSIRTRAGGEGDDPEGLFVVEVADTGIGIDPTILPRIFDPFQQGETTITRKFGGLGLGLAICKGIVEAHGGTIAVESAGKGRGTTFRVALKAVPEALVEGPAEPLAAAAAAGSAAPAVPLALRILVVEDEPTTLRMMARLLRRLGHEVAAAGTIAAALETFRAGAFDLVISDIGLPDGSGLDLIRQAITLRGPLPAIALTGYGMEDDIRRGREAGFTAHLTKPIDFTELELLIRQVVERGRPDPALRGGNGPERVDPTRGTL